MANRIYKEVIRALKDYENAKARYSVAVNKMTEINILFHNPIRGVSIKPVYKEEVEKELKEAAEALINLGS